MKKLALYFACLTVFIGCGEDEDEDKGAPLNAPQVQPPVANNLPTAMALTARTLNLVTQDEVDPRDGAISTVLGYLSTANGNVSPTARLGMIDERMASLDTRVQDSPPRVCLQSEATTHEWPGSFPGDETFELKFQCQETLNSPDDPEGETSNSQLAFGLDSESFYLYERTNTSSKVAVMAKAPLDGSRVEVWQVGLDGQTNGSSWLHLVGDDASGSVELAYAGEAIEFSQAMVCGVQVRASGTLVYAKGQFYSGSSCGDEIEFCLDGADGTEKSDISECEAAGLTEFSLTAMDSATDNIESANSELFITTAIQGGYEDFLVSTEPSEGEEE